MTNPHRHRNRASPEHIESIRNINLKIKQNNRRKALQGQLQKMAVDYSMNWKTHGADMDAIRAFKSKEVYSSGENHPSGSKFKFRSDGKSLFLHDYEVARHHKDGIEISNAGYDSPLTYKTHQALGINSKGHAKHPKGLITLGTKEIDKNSGEWVLVNHADISEEPIIPDTMRKNQKARADGTFVERKKPKRETAEQASFRRRATEKELKEQGRKGGKPLSKVNIQKTDQRIIDAISGLKKSLPTDKRGQAAHHLLEYSGDGDVGKKLGLNKKDNDDENNSIMLPHDYHDFISHYNTSNPKTNLDNLRQMDSKIRQLKGKLQKIAAVGMPKGFGKDPEEYSSFSDFLDKFQKGENPDLEPSKYPLPKYFEEDYEAFHDKVQDSAFRFEDASDAGIDIENKENENQLQGNWDDLSEPNKGSLRNYYQKHLSKELSWQKDTSLYTSGKLPESQKTYTQPGFHKNIIPDEIDPEGGYATINPKDIKPKFPKDYGTPGQFAKLKQKVALIKENTTRPSMKSLAQEITNKFRVNKLRGSVKGGFTYDPTSDTLLDASNREQALQIRKIFGGQKGKNLGFNSITQDDKGNKPITDIGIISNQLHKLEKSGKKPILGGYKQGLNASFSIHGSDKDILKSLPHGQESSLSIEPNGDSYLLYPNGKKELITQDSPTVSIVNNI